MPEIRKPLFVVPLALSNVTAGNQVAGHPASHLGRHEAMGLTWKTAGTVNAWAAGTFDSAQQVDFCAIIGATAQAGTRFRLRLGYSLAEVTSETAAYDSGPQPFIAPALNSGGDMTLSLDFINQIYQSPGPVSGDTHHALFELPAVRAGLWWSIAITGHSGDFEAAALVLGRKIEPSHFYNYDHEYGAEDLGTLKITRHGVFDEEPGLILRTVSFQLAWQSEAEWEASFRPMMERLGRRGIIYCCFDPTESDYRQARTYMGVMRKTPFARGTRKNRTFAQDFDILSLI